MKAITALFLSLYIVAASYAQSSVPPIAGWKMQEQSGRYLFMPASSGDGQQFVYEVMPMKNSNGESGSSWFKGVLSYDVQQSGYSIPASDNVQVVIQSGFYTYTTQVSDKSGRKWLIAYMGYHLNDEYRLARMISSPDAAYFKANIQPAIVHFGKLARQDGVKLEGTGTGSTAKAEEKKPATTSTRIKPDDLITENGLKPGEVKGIAIHLEYIAGVGGGIYPSYEPYLMLADGSVYDGPSVSPYRFDVAKSKQLEPRKWGTWKAVGKTIVISWPNKEKEKDKTDTWEKNWFWAKPAANGEKIQGSYKTISGGGNTAFGGNVMIVSASNITFNKNGQFTMVSTSGGSNSGDFGVSSSAYAHKDGAGTYILNGYSLELRFNNGQVKRQSFYFYPDSKETMGIGTSAYVPRK